MIPVRALQDVPASEAVRIDGDVPPHAYCSDLRTGVPSGPPAKKPVRTHEVVVVDGYIYVTVAAAMRVGV